jgi:hypothetical protein
MFDRWRSIELRRRLHRLSRGLIEGPEQIRSRKYHQQVDAKAGKNSSVEPGEHLEMVALWALEMYTPSNVRNLEQGLSRLGWLNERFGSNRDLRAWLQETRQGRTGGWTNIGIIRRPERAKFQIGPIVYGPLPSFAKYAYARVHALTPSLTCLVVCFVLNDEERGRFEVISRRKYPTKIRRHRYVQAIISPENQKREEVEAIRAAWSRDAAS